MLNQEAITGIMIKGKIKNCITAKGELFNADFQHGL